MKKLTGILLAGLVLAGCSRVSREVEKPDEPVAMDPVVQETELLAEIDDLLARIDVYLQEGAVDEAIEALALALDDEKYDCCRTMLYVNQLNLLINSGRIEEARAGFVENIGSDPDLTRAGFSTLYSYYMNADDPDSVLEWTDLLISSPLPDDLAATAMSWHMNACLAQDLTDRVVEMVGVCVTRFDDNACRGIFGGLVQSLVAEKRYSAAARLLTEIDDKASDRNRLKTMVAVSRTHLFFAQGRWIEAEKQFIQSSSILPDEELARSLRRVAQIAIGDEQFELVDRMCDEILKNQSEKPMSRREAAEQLMAVARHGKDNAEILHRMDMLVKFNITPGYILSFYRNNLQIVIQNGDKEDLVQTLRFGDRLAPLLSDERDIQDLESMALDLSFMAGDYDRSLKVIETGNLAYDDEWHEMAVNKIKAHIALQQGNNAEAVERFRKFMEHVETWESPEYDPSTGLAHTREMTLGFNSARIGDILKSAGDEEEAAKAYAEARSYYEYALKEVANENKERAHIEAALSKLPVVGSPVE